MNLDKTDINDIWLEENGEPIIGSNGDFKVSTKSDAILQSIMFRLKTVIGDFILEPQCGASLESMIGEPNSPNTAGRIEALVYTSLTHDNFLYPENLTIETFPMDRNNLAIIIQYLINNDTEINYAVSLDLLEGKLISKII